MTDEIRGDEEKRDEKIKIAREKERERERERKRRGWGVHNNPV